MKTALKRKTEKTTKKQQQTMLAVDALLDEALDETFPASDPVALTQPSLRRRAALKRRAGHERARSGGGTAGGRGARGLGGR